jgi:hypothetical protein
MLEFDPVGTVAFYRERHRVEAATTVRVLTALPSGNLLYTPHPRSSTVGDTAWTIIRGLRVSWDLLRLKADEGTWSDERTVTSKGAILLRQSLGQILWMFHFDAWQYGIHHRRRLWHRKSPRRRIPSERQSRHRSPAAK